jgi:hypothetical protein
LISFDTPAIYCELILPASDIRLMPMPASVVFYIEFLAHFPRCADRPHDYADALPYLRHFADAIFISLAIFSFR